MYLWVLSPVSEGGKKHKNISFHRGLDTPSPDEQQEWDIEDKEFYEKEGLNIATRNLWASVPNLLMGFAVWLMCAESPVSPP